MKLYKYNNYDEYKEIQIKGYQSKKTNVWVNTDHLKNILAPYILKYNPDVSFGICHGTRRGLEQQAFIDGFKKKIEENSFLEWEEVYENQYYGTLKSELQRIWDDGKTVIFDVDVIGGLNIKKQYPKNCLSIFIMPPSLLDLKARLIKILN